MAESIGRRVGRLLSGGLNALVEAVEDSAPEAVMAEAVREIEAAIEEVRSELGSVIAARHLASKRLMEENKTHEDLADQIQVAIDQARDDLAEVAVAKQMDIEAQIPVLEDTISEHSARERELEGFIAALQGRKREMEDELAAIKKIAAASEAPASASGGDATSAKAEQANAAFKRAMTAASGSARGDLPSAGSAAQLAELDELTRKHRVEERLAALKSARNKP